MAINRRTFVINVLCGSSALAASRYASAQAAVMVKESEPQAVALGYKEDATKVDKAKFPKYTPEQKCLNCQLYVGNKPPSAPCTIFANKHVAAQGWCSAWAKKSG